MALLSFPPNPTPGQVYPINPPVGTNIYIWDGTDQTWLLLGKSSGVSAAVYGTPLSVPEITVDATGRITFAQNIPIQLGTTSQIGLVQLTNDTNSNDPTTALTAAQGFFLQSQIGNTSLLNPPAPNLVSAINGVTTPSGVTAGTYGTATQVGRFTVSAQGRITSASNVALAVASMSSLGVVRVGSNLTVSGAGLLSVPPATTTAAGVTQLVNNTTTNDSTKALTASQGFLLQQQINTIVNSNNSIFAGSLDADMGILTQVAPAGASAGFAVGDPLPFPSGINDGYFVIVNTPGVYIPPGGAPVVCSVGDWFLSDGTQWIFFEYNLGSVSSVNTGVGLFGGPITSTGTIALANTSVTAGSYTNANITVDAQGRITSAANGSSGGVDTLQQVTTAGNTTTNFVDFLNSGNLRVRIDPTGSGVPIQVFPVNPSDAGFYISPTAAGFGNSIGTLYAAGTFPSGIRFDGSNGIELYTSSAANAPIKIRPGDTTDTVTFGVTSTSIANQLIASGLSYPTSDGLPNQVLSTDGAGTLSWINSVSTAGVTELLTGAGLTGGPITSTGTVSMTNTGVSPNTYTYSTVTVDINGRITNASSGTAPNTTVSSPITNSGTAVAPVIGIQNATTGQLGAVQVGTNIDVAAGVISVKSSSTTQSGIVQLNDTVTSDSDTEALTARQGKAIQSQVSALAVTSNLTLAGTFDAATSQMLTVTSQGSGQSFTVGNNLPAAAAGNLDYFVIVTTGGSYDPPGGGGPYTTNQGDWFLSNGTSWQFLNVGSDLPTASSGTAGIVELATVLETQTGTDTTIAVTPAGAAATYIPISSFTAKGNLLSATGANVPTALTVGSDNQILTACAAAATGLCWVTPPAVVPSIPCSVLTAKGALVAASGANTPATLPVGVNGQVLAACSTETTGLCWITPPAPTPQATPTVLGTVLGRVDLGSGGLGFRTLNSLTSGIYNVGIGQEAGCSITSGVRNIGIGVLAVSTATTSADNIGIGAEALRRTTTGYNNVAIGTTTLVFNTTGADNVAVGYDAQRANTTGFQNVAIGVRALNANNTFAQNTAVGAFALEKYNGGTNGTNDAFGAITMCNFTSGDYNVALGAYSLFCYQSGCYNTAVGHRALTDVTTGTCNTGVGAFAGQCLTTGICNTALGWAALVRNGNNNTVLGAGAENVSGASNSVTLGNSSITVIRAQVTSITALSDARDKTDVTALPVGLDFINSLNPVKFTWQMREPNEVKDGTSEAGFIAQDLQAAQEAAGADYLGLVYDEDPEKLEASAGKLVPVLVKAIQELSGKVNFLQEELDRLKSGG